ncbi:efflux RND transporter periplasmic adaptor subunit [Sinorhizobium terangae]|uniref:efflux RND transporter periplasmic adaptor subunit n=1 Tax=Sinorhizobium terangae TaxID=110322 RepID=UPI0024B23AC2|nr:efflux RND transporter periplasmic adaptor subunit [Sinorhizobium terangae]WFU51328.1 efflux RND transporter periplasmic adaptor subunit [Sinorhizobium terangae]
MQPFRLIGIGLACAYLAGCEDKVEVTPSPQQVRAVSASQAEYQPRAEITGEVKARVQSDLSFRVSGRVIERFVDVGSHVRTGDVLARLDDKEQRADVEVARAGLESARAIVKQRTLTFDRYEALLRSRSISQATFDQADKELRTAKASLEAAEAALATAEDALSYTELKADADGIITAREIEVGRVVSAAQPAFTLAHDGRRDAVFDVFEAFFLEGRPLADVEVAPIADRALETQATVREVSPFIDTRTGTVRIKVALPEDAQWPLGTPVVGEFRSPTRKGIILPAGTIASAMGEPAVFLIDPASRSVSLRKIAVASYRKSDLIVAGGIAPQDLIVTEGGKFLKEGQAVAWKGK